VTILLLARHGETDWNRDNRFQGRADPPLNDTGRTQARGLAARPALDEVAAVYSGPLRRAWETAEIVAAHLDLPVQLDPELVEIDVGEWQGLTRSEVDERFPEAFRRWLDHGPGWERGETYEEMARRTVHVLERIAGRHLGQNVLVVMHSGPIRAAHAHAEGIPFDQARRLGPPLHNCGLFAADFEGRSFRRLD